MYITRSELNLKMTLPDGRSLGFAEYGDRTGRTVLYFTGGNSSRYEGQWFQEAARRHQIRLIVPDRPGFGLSGFQAQRTFADWADDVRHLLQYLDVDACAVFGLSGGSPHVIAACLGLPEFVTRAAIVSGVAPPEMPKRFKGMWLPVRLLFFCSRYLPRAARFLLGQMSSFYADKEQLLSRMKQALPAPDVALIESRPEVMEIFSAAAAEAHRYGVYGDAWEWQLYVRPWHLALDQVQQEVGLWYGELDKNVPVEMGRYLQRQLPHSELHIVPDGGHFSTINNHIDAVLAFLLGE